MQVGIGPRIKQAREEAGLTQVELGQLIGQAERTIQSWESGERHPRLPGLHALARATGKPLSWFWTAEGAAA